MLLLVRMKLDTLRRDTLSMISSIGPVTPRIAERLRVSVCARASHKENRERGDPSCRDRTGQNVQSKLHTATLATQHSVLSLRLRTRAILITIAVSANSNTNSTHNHTTIIISQHTAHSTHNIKSSVHGAHDAKWQNAQRKSGRTHR